MDLSEIDAQLEQAAARRDQLQRQYEATLQARNEAGAQLTLGGERYRQIRVDALASGQELDGTSDDLRLELDTLRNTESMHMRELEDLEAAARQVTGTITKLREQRENQIRSEIFPAYEQFMAQTASTLIKSLAMRLVPVARVNGQNPAGCSPERIFEVVMGQARTSGEWDAAVQEALAYYKQKMEA